MRKPPFAVPADIYMGETISNYDKRTTLKVGMKLRNKETGELVKIKKLGYMIEYSNPEVDGEVQASVFSEHFDIVEKEVQA